MAVASPIGQCLALARSIAGGVPWRRSLCQDLPVASDPQTIESPKVHTSLSDSLLASKPAKTLLASNKPAGCLFLCDKKRRPLPRPVAQLSITVNKFTNPPGTHHHHQASISTWQQLGPKVHRFSSHIQRRARERSWQWPAPEGTAWR